MRGAVKECCQKGNDLNLKFDLSFRDDLTNQRVLDRDQNVPTGVPSHWGFLTGQTTSSMTVTLRLFWLQQDHTGYTGIVLITTAKGASPSDWHWNKCIFANTLSFILCWFRPEAIRLQVTWTKRTSGLLSFLWVSPYWGVYSYKCIGSGRP